MGPINNSLVKIIIPIYKLEFSRAEQLCFERCITLMKDYPIVLAIPKKMNITSLLSNYSMNFEIEEFDDYFFSSILGYNHLLLSSCFYERFTKSKYILICQLDVYIFKDQLKEWCNKGYDYIGAPWLKKKKYDRWYYRIYWLIKRKLYQKIGIRSYHDVFDVVGNGGFSLRNVDSALKTLYADKKLANEYKRKCKNKRFNEDVFWALEMPKILSSVHIPTKEEAVRFAFDVQVDECFELNNHQLPFAAHGWPNRLNFYDKFIHFS